MNLLDKSIKILITIFVLFLPLTNRDLFSFGIDFLIPVRIVFLILLVCIAFKAIIFWKKCGLSVLKKYLKTQAKDRLLILLSILWLVRVVSFVNSKNISASLNLIAFYTSMIVLYVLLKYIFSKDAKFSFFLFKTYLLSIIFSVFYALVQILSNLLLGVTLPGLLVGGNYYRVPGPFYDANHLPAFLITGIPSFVARGFYHNALWKKIILYASALTCAIVLFLTFSRSGFIGFGVSIIVALFLIIRYRYWAKLLIPLALVGFLILIVFLSDRTSHSLVDRMFSVFNQAERSTAAHTILLQGEIDLYLKNPILGVGYGSFSEHFRDSYYGQEHLKIDPTRDIRLPPHSIWLEVLTETGTIGFIVYCAIMFTILRKLLGAINRALNKQWRIYFIALFASVVGILSSGFFYSYNLELFWFFLFYSYLLAANYHRFTSNSGDADLNESEYVNWTEVLIPVTVMIVSFLVIFGGLGSNALIEFDEGIYGLIAKNMSSTGDYLVATVRSNTPWFEKPPLYMWLTAPMIKLFGVDAFSVKFWSAMFSVSTVLATYFLAKLLTRSRYLGVLASLVLLTTFHFLRYSRMGMLDVTVTFFMTLSVLLLLLARRRAIFWLLAGLSLGLGFMTKDFVSLLILPVLGLILFSYRKDYVFRKSWLFLVGFALVSAPWHIYTYQRFGFDFLNSYVGYHIISRFSSDIEGKTGPLLVYVDVLKNSLRIWFPILGLSLIFFITRFLGLRKLGLKKLNDYLSRLGFNRSPDFKVLGILFVWALSILVPLSLSRTKLIWYIVPVYPVLAVIISIFFADLSGMIFSQARRFNLKMKTEQLKFVIYTIILLSLSIISFIYLYMKWNLVDGRDFNGDMVKLIYIKQQIEPSGKIPLAFVDVGEAVPRFYAEGTVEIWPPEMLRSLGLIERTRYLIAKRDFAYKVMSTYTEENPLRIEASLGDFILMKRQGPE
ncbi:MAG: hypothetical protein A3A61_02175 [Candidatus Woykebacteria bacterium RIFCSPLOWO2_01_FULL_43_14]|uniref:Uncharacterized protein n=1 Tax=Candidatus Woykebacteria bacterium RIFCSPLOWO2_01_FULL_43_14 TaxID=1802605 RepID=A0A1G1WVQ4_9BACT|nr:MAG: hypothetical protein A3A61_02175 [Candidatus Woykebacteria bacterium RIFCSPLOWO2_01_FULL_43_14]